MGRRRNQSMAAAAAAGGRKNSPPLTQTRSTGKTGGPKREVKVESIPPPKLAAQGKTAKA